MFKKLPTPPVEVLASDLNLAHGPHLASMAALVHATEHLFTLYGRAHGVDLDPLLAVQRECIDEWLMKHNLLWPDLDSACNDLRRASAVSAVGGPPALKLLWCAALIFL